MPTYTTRDGRTFEWTGLGICVCTKCDEIFNSVAAFDHHLIYAKDKKGHATHDFSNMPRNSRGYLVTALAPEALYSNDHPSIRYCSGCEVEVDVEEGETRCPDCGSTLTEGDNDEN